VPQLVGALIYSWQRGYTSTYSGSGQRTAQTAED